MSKGSPKGARNPVAVTPPKGRRQTSEALKADTYEALKADGVGLGLFPHADGEGRRI